VRCGACGAPTRRSARFCDQCGAPLDATGGADRATRPREDVEAGDRRIVTALFADLVDYVRLVAEEDPEDVRRKVDAALRAMVEAIRAFDGTREKFIGDAVFAVFGWPQGHDDDALRAAHCALAIREALTGSAGSAGTDAAADEPLQVHIGIATGEVVAGQRSDDALDWSLTGPGGHDGGADPGDRPAQRDPARRGDGQRRAERPRGRGRGANAAPRPDPTHPRLPAPRRRVVPALAAAGRDDCRPGRGTAPAAGHRREPRRRPGLHDRPRRRGRDG
jgi:hypothetical protein